MHALFRSSFPVQEVDDDDNAALLAEDAVDEDESADSSEDSDPKGIEEVTDLDTFQCTFYTMQLRRIDREGRSNSQSRWDLVNRVALVTLVLLLFQELLEEWIDGGDPYTKRHPYFQTLSIGATILEVCAFLLRAYSHWFETFFTDALSFALSIWLVLHSFEVEPRLLYPSVLTYLILWAILLFIFRGIKPTLMQTACWNGVGALCWFRLRQEEIAKDDGHLPDIVSLRFSYLPQGPFSIKRCFCGYIGYVDKLGKPHGHGRWFDMAFHGEVMEGLWEHGEPGRVFESITRGVAAQTRQFGVAYATSRADCQPGKLSNKFEHPEKEGQLRYGCIECEVAVAGVSYTGLPRMTGEDTLDSVPAMVSWMGDIMDAAAVHGNGQTELLDVFAGGPSVRTTGSDSNNAGNGIVGVERTAPDKLSNCIEQEALVFIHGFNYSISTACKKLVQMIILGGLGPNVTPFIFSWSSGNIKSAFTSLGDVKVHASDYGDDLAEFLQGLGRHFRQIHLLTHSMGALLLFHNFSKLEHCFSLISKAHLRTPPTSPPKLSTVTLLNPDVLIEDAMLIIPRMLRYADRITAYNDQRDKVLLLDWVYQLILPRESQLWRSDVTDDDEDDEVVMLGSSVSPLWLESVNGSEDAVLRKGSMNSHLSFRFGSSSQEKLRWDPEAVVAMKRRPEAFSRIDIIDTTTIDTHVGFDRHNYYGLHPLVVQDVCELISQQLPACKRVRLTRTNCNVFRFRMLPYFLG